MPSIAFYRKLCDSSFFHFVRLVGGYVEQGGCISEEIHHPLCDFFQDQSIKRRAIFMPRNWLKTTVFTQWGAIWNYLRNPDCRTLIVSANDDKASSFLWFIQHQLLNNPVLKKIYPETQQINQEWKKNHRWSQKYVELPRSIPYKEASITSIGVIGQAQGGHYDHLFIDDPVGQKHIDSVTELDRVLRWHDNSKELLDNPNHKIATASDIQLICTFWGPGDYGTYVMENYPEYHWRIVPALLDDELRDTDNVKYIQNHAVEPWKSNWEDAPEGKSTTEYYIELLANAEQDSVFWSQHMNNPSKGKGLRKFDKDWLKYYHWEERDEGLCAVCNDDNEVFVVSKVAKYGMIDPSGFREVKMMKRGSRNAILIGGQPWESRKKFVFYTWAGKLKKPSKFLDEIFKAHELFNPNLWRIDPCGQQGYIYNDILEARERRGKYLPITQLPYSNKKDEKDEDILACATPMSNGEIYIHESMKELKIEVEQFPGGFTKDLVDMLGKINKHYWTRKKKEDYRESQKDRRYDLIRQRGIAGY